ncbi:hypothetical protein JVU11DRAFT_1426 [Chiua virens]|nr:hypothetical protein JVU11DRAFT_1426 [Chiua virens]
MAKSLRSKSKRSYRAKKRETGKYAAAEAARLHRLNAKLAVIKSQPEEDVAEEGTVATEEEEAQRKGSYDYDSETFFACLGLLHPRSVTPQNLALLSVPF